MKNFTVSQLMEMGAQFQKDRKINISTDTKTVRELYELYLDGKLVLQDWFQSGFHWDHNKKVMLIHTLINTPKLLTEVVFFIDNDGKYYVADGQQRLTSILTFWTAITIIRGRIWNQVRYSMVLNMAPRTSKSVRTN